MLAAMMSVIRLGRRRHWAALALASSLAGNCAGQGTIAHVTAPEDFGTFQGGNLPVDLDGDGSNDFNFVSTRGDFSVDGPSLNAVLALPAGGLDLGGWAVPVREGATVRAELPDGLVWYETIHTQYGSLPALLTSCMDVGCIGFFTGENAYLGVRFQAADGTHYGWMRLELPYVGINGGYVREWAYETRPDTPILVPEPSTVVVLIGGGVWLMSFGFSSRSRVSRPLPGRTDAPPLPEPR